MIWLVPLRVDIDPYPEYAEEDSDNSWQVQVHKRPTQREIVDMRRKDDSAFILTFDEKILKRRNEGPADEYREH